MLQQMKDETPALKHLVKIFDKNDDGELSFKELFGRESAAHQKQYKEEFGMADQDNVSRKSRKTVAVASLVKTVAAASLGSSVFPRCITMQCAISALLLLHMQCIQYTCSTTHTNDSSRIVPCSLYTRVYPVTYMRLFVF
jgi:hypothetical protein